MGGLHSGRDRRHSCINDCLMIDTALLRKDGLFDVKQEITFPLAWRTTSHTNFVETKNQKHRILATYTPGDEPTLLVSWGAEITLPDGRKEHAEHRYELPLVWTACNYGGRRWWFACPGCCHRARVLYINLKSDVQQMKPRCQRCLNLHYASQVASYIDRHKTYERYLLANYGQYWASYRYNFELKEHYLEMTPELWALRMKSVIDWNMHLLKATIRCDLAIHRTDLAVLKSLRSEEDRRNVLAHMRERSLDTRRFFSTVYQCVEYERLLCALSTGATRVELDQIYARLAALQKEEEESAPVVPDIPPHAERELEQKIISLEAMLREVNKSTRKKAA